MKSKKRIIISTLIIIGIILISLPLYSAYKENQMKKLVEVTNHMFETYIKKGEQTYASQNMKAKYTPTETVLIAGDSKEFVALVYFELNVDVNGENDYTSAVHTMRIKKINKNDYKIIAEGDEASTKNLKLLNYSNKNNEELDKIKEEVNNEEYEKIEGIGYSANAQEIMLTYDNERNWVKVPISTDYILSNVKEPQYENPEEAPAIIKPILKENTYYISHEKTAFISTNQSDILITISNDKGKSWSEFTLDGAYQGGDLYIGFSSEDVGYFAFTTDVAMGTQYNYIYTTKDGGKTWSEIGNTNEVYHRVVTGIGFLDDKVGFVGFRYESDNNPTVYRTDDAGDTWNKIEVHLPYEYASDYATPLSPKFKDDIGILPVKLRDNDKIINFVSKDKGLTWVYSEDIAK
ncbi:exo-alpha-sialidase [Romboutsia weinsteinii]|uniref:Exo-alpha-sialidase n=1 Tax=Romboutsia weinsteinii TaxID=2020949 RepID=A0A371J0E3_9FIRM|nr:sialidase family protein [Romboutsia weinsteinii]RDY26271.1 exo-alpha-sialidase [Romboutsia weinsteinii]